MVLLDTEYPMSSKYLLTLAWIKKRWITVQNEIFQRYDTRWACRYSACNVIMESLPALFRVLRDIDEEES